MTTAPPANFCGGIFGNFPQRGDRMKGRKPTPIVTLRARNTFRPDRHAHRATEPDLLGDGQFDPPEYFSESQKDCWRFVVQNAPAGILKQIDSSLLTCYV